MEYLIDIKIQYRCQSGFWKNHSKDTCLLYLADKILTGIDCFNWDDRFNWDNTYRFTKGI